MNKAYWACQVTGWSAFMLFQVLGLNFAKPAERPPMIRYVTAVALLCLGGIVVTHFIRLHMRRRRWMEMPLRQAWPRLAGAVVTGAAMLAGINLMVAGLIVHTHPAREILRPQNLILPWVNFFFLLTFWMALYLAIHGFRRRRLAEVQTLLLELVAQEAQLRGLRAQLNPHFLFNCLNSLRELIVEDPGRAQTMVTQLSGLLRYSLQSGQTEQVSMQEEAQAVKDYLALEAIRFEERLQVRWDIDSEVNNIQVPPMLLQTLVENALKHGIARLPQGGEISIQVRVRDSQLELEVVNSGDLAEQPTGEGIGLRNARARLQLLYGDRAKITLESITAGKVRALGTIPVTRAGAGQ